MNNFNCEILAIDKHESHQNTRSVELSNKQESKIHFFVQMTVTKTFKWCYQNSHQMLFSMKTRRYLDQNPLLLLQNNVTSFEVFFE